MESSGQLFKQNLDKAFGQPGITLNASTMADAQKYKKSFKENEDVEKKSIDCSNPKNIRQKNYCRGREKKEPKEATGTGSSGAYSGPLFSGEEAVLEKSESKESSTGRKSPIGFSDEYIEKSNAEKKGVTEDLGRWFKEKWVDVSKKVDGKHPPCGRPDADSKGYPKCRAAGVAGKMTDSEKKSACSQKRREEKKNPKSGKGNKPTMTSYKPRKESIREIIKNILKEEIKKPKN
jgi:hypothetical protein